MDKLTAILTAFLKPKKTPDQKPKAFMNIYVERSIERPAEPPDDDEDDGSTPIYADDDAYEHFVERMWSAPQIPMSVDLLCDGEPYRACGLVPAKKEYPYVNLLRSDGRRVSFAGDNRHLWEKDGLKIDASAFFAIVAGTSPDEALRYQPYPSTLEEALAADRHPTKDKRMALNYRNGAQIVSWRVISRIIRSKDYLTAKCHFRYGQRRTFLYEGVLDLIDLSTGKSVGIASLIPSEKPKAKAKPKAKSSPKM